MLHYLIRRADRNSKPLTKAQRSQARAWTLLIAFAIVAVVLIAAG